MTYTSRLTALATLIAVLSLTGCQSRTTYGECVGLGEKQDPTLRYKASTRNVIVGVIFVEMIAPPVFVAVDELYCPVGKVIP